MLSLFDLTSIKNSGQLRFQLRSDYYTLIQQVSTLSILDDQLNQLQKLILGMNAQLTAGNIAQKDYLRIQALNISLEQDRVELIKSITDTEADLKSLLQLKNKTFIKPLETGFENVVPTVLINSDIIFDTAKKNNPNYQLQETQTLLQQQNLTYQKALRTPDLTIGPNFDRNSSFAPNYIGLGISLPLPIANTNKGNIKFAEYGVKQQQSLTANAETTLWNNINNKQIKHNLIKL